MNWGQLYAHLKVSLGYTNEQIDEMTLPMIAELNEYWGEHPPMHLLVKNLAIYFGAYKIKEESRNDMGEFMSMTNVINGAQQ